MYGTISLRVPLYIKSLSGMICSLGVGFSQDDEPPWSIASRAAELGGEVRIGRGDPAGGHVVVKLPAR